MNMHTNLDTVDAILPRQWYIARFHPSRIEAFKDLMKDHKVATYIPEESRRVRCGFMKTRLVTRPLLGNYGFVDPDDISREYYRLRERAVFQGLMACGEGLALVYDYEVDVLRLLEAKTAGTLSTADFMQKIGDLVRFKAEKRSKLSNGQTIVETAAFGGFVVKILDICYTDRIRYFIELNLFGSTHPTWVDASEFEPA